jgi:hypothetical protein
VLGQGGLIDTGLGIIGDLQSVANGTGGLINIIGAAQKAGLRRFEPNLAVHMLLLFPAGVMRGDLFVQKAAQSIAVLFVVFVEEASCQCHRLSPCRCPENAIVRSFALKVQQIPRA